MDSQQAWRVALGVVVRQLRLESGVSQERLAHHIHVTRNTVQGIERGATNVGFDTLIRLCEVLGIKPSQLLSRTEELVDSPARLTRATDQLETERRRGRPPSASGTS